MKIKILSIIMAVFFAGMVCMGTYALADVKKPPALGDDGEPVKYTDESGDYYWGTDGYLYPWPPPETFDEAALELIGLEAQEQALLFEYAQLEDMLKWMYEVAFEATEADDLESQERISNEIEHIRKGMAEIKNELKEKRKKIKAAKGKKGDDAAFRDAMDRVKSIYNKPKKKYPSIFIGAPNDHAVSSPTTDKPAPELPGKKCDGK